MYNYEQIEYKGYLYTIPYLEHEPYDIFIKRAWFIVKQFPITHVEFTKATYNSILWANIQFKKCIYSENIMNNIHKLEENYLNIT